MGCWPAVAHLALQVLRRQDANSAQKRLQARWMWQEAVELWWMGKLNAYGSCLGWMPAPGWHAAVLFSMQGPGRWRNSATMLPASTFALPLTQRAWMTSISR